MESDDEFNDSQFDYVISNYAKNIASGKSVHNLSDDNIANKMSQTFITWNGDDINTSINNSIGMANTLLKPFTKNTPTRHQFDDSTSSSSVSSYLSQKTDFNTTKDNICDDFYDDDIIYSNSGVSFKSEIESLNLMERKTPDALSFFNDKSPFIRTFFSKLPPVPAEKIKKIFNISDKEKEETRRKRKMEASGENDVKSKRPLIEPDDDFF
uniref:INCENP_ARK-bind domain-containing protein n=1 Tax=Parastrongyloides trichosuri TaxID=131310 RepID=A0A0N4ZU12_PARTI